MRFFLCLFLMFVASVFWPDEVDKLIDGVGWVFMVAIVVALGQDMKEIGS